MDGARSRIANVRALPATRVILCETHQGSDFRPVVTATSNFCSSIRKRSSKAARAYFRRHASSQRTRSVPPPSPAPRSGCPAPAPGAPVARPSPGALPTRAHCAVGRQRARRSCRPGWKARPTPAATWTRGAERWSWRSLSSGSQRAKCWSTAYLAQRSHRGGWRRVERTSRQRGAGVGAGFPARSAPCYPRMNIE
jgi:hypothetical protein